jgi:hypothetical protein
MLSMTEPHMRAWADQFGALLRDKCRQGNEAAAVTGWSSFAHIFPDDDGDYWRLVYSQGMYSIENLADPEGEPVLLDLDELGVYR